MPAGKRSIWTALGFAWALALCFVSEGAQAQVGTRAGVAAAVRGPVQQISYSTPQGVGRNVGSGDRIHLGDRIVTGPGGGVQIMLLDGTTFTIGPNSSMVIDEFVYNPATGTGKLTASLARGTLRVISGKLSRQTQEAIRIKLPMATVGIRGTMVVISGGPNGFFIGLFGVGANNSADRPQSLVFVSNNGTGNGIFREGYGCTVTPAAPVCNAQKVGPESLQILLGQIGGNAPNVSITEFERRTGLDLVAALKLLQSPGGFEQFVQIVDKLHQDASRPGNAPTTPPSCPYPCSN